MKRWLPSRKRLYAWHGWLGLHLGLLLYAICFSGTVAVFTPEIDAWIDPARWVEVPALTEQTAPDKMSWGTVQAAVRVAHPAALINYHFRDPDPAAADVLYLAYGPGDVRRVFVDPYRSQITGVRSYLDVKSFVRIFHKQFYLVSSTIGFHGTLLVGAFALVLLGAGLTGLCAFPCWWRALVTLRLHRGARACWSDLHRMLGTWALLVLLVLGLTGAWYWGAQIATSADLIDHDPPAARIDPATLTAHGETLRPLPIDELVRRARSAYPALRIDRIALPNALGRGVRFMGQADTVLVRSAANVITLDPYSGAIMQRQSGHELGLVARLDHSMDPLHFGTFGGIATRWLYFICGLALSLGILLGAVIHVRRTAVARARASVPGRRWLWTWSGWLTTLTLLAAAGSGAAYIRVGQLPSAPVATDWQAVAAVTWGASQGTLWTAAEADADRRAVRIAFPHDAWPNLQRAELVVDEAAVIPLRVLPGTLLGSVPAGTALEPARIALRGTPGETTAPRSVPFAALPIGPRAVRMPPPPQVPTTVWITIGVFMVLVIVPTALWLLWLRRPGRVGSDRPRNGDHPVQDTNP